MDEIISKVELEDEVLLVELKNGIRFYGQQDKALHPVMKYADPQKLGKIAKFKYFSGFLGPLCEQYVEGAYEKYYELKKGEFVVDAGAHIGTFTVKAAKAVGEAGMVVAIEPEVNNLKLLQRNIEVNKLRNVVIVSKGIWGAKEKLKLNLSRQTMGQHSLYRNHFYETDNANEFEEVEVDTLDNILGELGVKEVDFIKMDIEGAEIEAIKGMDETLRNNDVNLAIAAYHIVEGKTTDKTIIPWLREKGFEIQKRGGIVYAQKRASANMEVKRDER